MVRAAIRMILLTSGAVLSWRYADRLTPSLAQIVLVAAACIAMAWPVSRRAIVSVYTKMNWQMRRHRLGTGVAVAGGSALFLIAVSLHAGRSLKLAWHDEHAYAIQVQQLMAGAYWEPAHALGDFFDSHYLLIKPVYAAIYFPGTAIVHLPGALLGLPFWVTAVLVSAIAAAMVYRIIAWLVDDMAGLLAALMFMSVDEVRHVGVMLLSHLPLLMWACLLFWALLRWRRRPTPGGAALMGVFAGLAMVTRPPDAFAWACGALVAMAPSLWRMPRAEAARTVAAGLAGLAPLVGLQLLVNVNVTGSPATFPHQYAVTRDYPQAEFGFHDVGPHHRPQSVIPQKQMFYYGWYVPRIQSHSVANLPAEWDSYRAAHSIRAWSPQAALVVLMPLGILGLTDSRRIGLAVTLPISAAVYSCYCFLLPAYPLAVLPAGLLLVVLAIRELAPSRSPRDRCFRVALWLAVVGLVVGGWPFLDRRAVHPGIDDRELRWIDDMIADLEHKPAVVLFRWSPQTNLHIEPVYNTDVAWPDDAVVVRAHDLGKRNEELVAYYSEFQPQRHLYIYDRATRQLNHFGTVGELWAQVLAEQQTPPGNPVSPADGDEGALPGQ